MIPSLHEFKRETRKRQMKTRKKKMANESSCCYKLSFLPGFLHSTAHHSNSSSLHSIVHISTSYEPQHNNVASLLSLTILLNTIPTLVVYIVHTKHILHSLHTLNAPPFSMQSALAFNFFAYIQKENVTFPCSSRINSSTMASQSRNNVISQSFF